MSTHRPHSLLLFALLFWALGTVCVFAEKIDLSPDAWKSWKSIDAAIALRPLDGPEDILEKAEIIQDRMDELKREKTRVDEVISLNQQKLQTIRSQRQVLHDLASIQMGGDAQMRRRLQELAERIRRQEIAIKKQKQSVTELQKEHKRMQNLFAEYQEKARLLKLKEGGAQ